LEGHVDPRIARRVVAAALLAGIGADILFDRVGLGINVPIATGAILALATWFGPRHNPVDPLDWWLPAVAFAASLGPALRTDPTVVPLDLLLIAFAATGWGIAVSGVAVTRRSAAAVTILGIRAGIVICLAMAWLLARAGADGFFSRRSHLGSLAPLVRGAIIAVPVVVGFGVLLGSADAVFGKALDDALNLPLELSDVAGRGWFATIAACLIAGPLALAAGASSVLERLDNTTEPGANRRAVEIGEAGPGATPAVTTTRRRVGATETLVVLVGVDVLFAAFAVVQVVYLFGGADTLVAVGMTYSEYARQGYFQLVGVVALAGLLLLGAHEVVGRTRAFLLGGLPLLGLTAVILASAALRLSLYQGAYGWTELRFFVGASIAWLALCVGWAAALLLADRMRWLPHALAGSAVAVTLAVSAIGPQAFVMHENVARVLDPRLIAPGGSAGLDINYGLTLGEDALPSLASALEALPERDRGVVLRVLQQRRDELTTEMAGDSPLAWNLARIRAREALATLPD
jgi:hypothetical protein